MSSSTSDVHASLLANLESALDVRKMMSVFTSFVGILKDQQGKMDLQQSKILELEELMQQQQSTIVSLSSAASSYKMPITDNSAFVEALPRIIELEKKIEEIELFTKGGGFADDSVLHKNTMEVSPFVAFTRSSMFSQQHTRSSNNSYSHSNDNGDSFDEEEEEEEPSDADRQAQREQMEEEIRKTLSIPRLDVPGSLPATGRKSTVNTERKTPLLTPKPEEQPVESVGASKPSTSRRLSSRKPSFQMVQEEAVDKSAVPEEPEDSLNPAEEETKADASEEIEKLEQMLEQEKEQLELAKMELEDEEKESSPEQSEEPLVEEAAVEKVTEELTASNDDVLDEPAAEDENERAVLDEKLRPSELMIKEELSRSVDELAIGEVRELPPSSASRKSRQRAIPDFKPPSSYDQQQAYDSSAPLTSRKTTPAQTPRTSATAVVGRGLSYRQSPRYPGTTVHLSRRRMTITNLPFLNSKMCKRILQALKMRGRFLRISREMFEEQRKKYSTQSLKQKIDYLEAEIIRISSKLDKLKDNTKKNNISIKEGFSFIKSQNDHFQQQLNSIEDDIQGLVKRKPTVITTPSTASGGTGSELLNDEAFQKLFSNASSLNELLSLISNKGGMTSLEKLLHLNNKSRILSTDSFLNPSSSSADSENENENGGVLSNIANHIKMKILAPELSIIHNEFSQYHHKLSELNADICNKNDINNMLKSSTESSVNLDSNHMKLMNLINKSITSSQERNEKLFDEKLKKLFSSSFLLNSMGNDRENANRLKSSSMSDNDMIDEKKLLHFKEEIMRMENESQLKIHRVEDDILYLKDQIHYLELYRLENINEIQKLEKARQVEGEQLKILQKRISNLSVDKVRNLLSCSLLLLFF
jgi:hypothetical protein